jgi:glycerol-3-phosphate dehydrogenase (NAD(P)+)
LIRIHEAAVIGGGAWGTALAVHLAKRGSRVRLWILEDDLVERMRERRDNPVYLPGVPVPDLVIPTNSLAESVDGAGIVIAVVPTQYARGVFEEMAPAIPGDCPVVLANKGIEEDTLAFPLRIASETLGQRRPLAVLSGPSFALEVAREIPTTLVAASESGELAVNIRDLLSGRTLRIYTNEDPLGVQVAGALKNVMAIAAGLVDGLGMGHNTLAALFTRGLAEMTRLGIAMGGKASTFSGLAGLGDLVLTCTGHLSRNRSVGCALGRGERLEDILSRMRSVAEGVRTARSARDLARGVGVEMPIVEEVHRILYEDGSPAEAVTRLMGRPLTSECGGRP